MGKIDFDLVKFLFLVSLHFLLLNKSKNTFPPGTGSANVFKLMFFECPFWGNSQHFLRPCAHLKSNHSKWYFVIGVLKQFGTNCRVPFFLFQKSLHPSTNSPITVTPVAGGRSLLYRLFCTGGINPSDPWNPMDNRENGAMVFCRDKIGKKTLRLLSHYTDLPV